MNIREDLIIEAFLKNQAIDDTIDVILESEFVFDQSSRKVRIKRGIVHTRVANLMNVKLNNTLCIMIRDRVIAKGGVLIHTNHTRYYKFLKERSDLGM